MHVRAFSGPSVNRQANSWACNYCRGGGGGCADAGERDVLVLSLSKARMGRSARRASSGRIISSDTFTFSLKPEEKEGDRKKTQKERERGKIGQEGGAARETRRCLSELTCMDKGL